MGSLWIIGESSKQKFQKCSVHLSLFPPGKLLNKFCLFLFCMHCHMAKICCPSKMGNLTFSVQNTHKSATSPLHLFFFLTFWTLSVVSLMICCHFFSSSDMDSDFQLNNLLMFETQVGNMYMNTFLNWFVLQQKLAKLEMSFTRESLKAEI